MDEVDIGGVSFVLLKLYIELFVSPFSKPIRCCDLEIQRAVFECQALSFALNADLVDIAGVDIPLEFRDECCAHDIGHRRFYSRDLLVVNEDLRLWCRTDRDVSVEVLCARLLFDRELHLPLHTTC